MKLKQCVDIKPCMLRPSFTAILMVVRRVLTKVFFFCSVEHMTYSVKYFQRGSRLLIVFYVRV